MRLLPRMLFFGFALAFPLRAAEEPPPLFCDLGAIKVQEDRFSGHSSARIEVTSLPPLGAMVPSLFWSSQFPDRIGVTFYGRNPEWEYLKCNTTYALLDGKRLDLATVEHDGTVTTSGVIEYMNTYISFEEARKFNSGRVFEYKICNDVFKASDTFICETRDLIRAVENWKKKSRPPG